jgi:glycosyltransferase involved in cell wall biosynthesis
MKVGLVGLSCESGAGNNSKRLWRQLPFARWLACARPDMGYGLWDEIPRQEHVLAWARGDWETLDRFLSGLDVVVCYQSLPFQGLFEHSRSRGIKNVLIANAEVFNPSSDEAQNADLLILRNADGHRVIQELGYGDRSVVVPCPMDLTELPFAERVRADRFVFSNGACFPHNRKGFKQLIEAVELGGLEGLKVFTQVALYDDGEKRLHAAKIPLFADVESPRDLYRDADVAVAPSRYEGVGLAILEAMACGVPCITTNHSPMRDYITGAYEDRADPFLIDVAQYETVVVNNKPYAAATASALSLNDKFKALKGSDIAWYSQAARRYIERVHGKAAWDATWKAITSV